MLKQVLDSIFRKPATTNYPFTKAVMPDKFRGKIIFHPEKCIGCKMCMRDCPAGAIQIRKIGDKKFECEIDLGKCIYCAQCVDSCLKKALETTKEFELAALERNKLKVTYHADTGEVSKE
ncbi:MAG: 4Fe-4S dicluster domain-containing protein [Candidatus Omnitrophica bacterium]|nr:4Fe-4S dicluster domain-containing protein [Candidatus Omnitrophota bacterium]